MELVDPGPRPTRATRARDRPSLLRQQIASSERRGEALSEQGVARATRRKLDIAVQQQREACGSVRRRSRLIGTATHEPLEKCARRLALTPHEFGAILTVSDKHPATPRGGMQQP